MNSEDSDDEVATPPAAPEEPLSQRQRLHENLAPMSAGAHVSGKRSVTPPPTPSVMLKSLSETQMDAFRDLALGRGREESMGMEAEDFDTGKLSRPVTPQSSESDGRVLGADEVRQIVEEEKLESPKSERSDSSEQKHFVLTNHTVSDFKADVILNPSLFPDVTNGDYVEIYHPSRPDRKILLKVTTSDNFRGNIQVSLLKSITRNPAFQLQTFQPVVVQKVDEKKYALFYVEVSFKDQYISQGELWRFRQALRGRSCYIGQKVTACGLNTTFDEMLGRGNRPVACGVITPFTKFIFRSCSARLFWLVQMSKEMWEFTEDGDLYFERFLNRFVSKVFDRWTEKSVTHRLTIVYFSRTYFDRKPPDSKPAVLCDFDGRYYTDLYHTVVENETRSNWKSLKVLMKREFHKFPMISKWEAPPVFYREGESGNHEEYDDAMNSESSAYFQNVVVENQEFSRAHRESAAGKVYGLPCAAQEGNCLEAINLCLNILDKHFMDRDLVRTGQAMVLVTPGCGVFEVDRRLTSITKQRMMDNAIGCDFVSLTRAPLHVAPLFVYKPSNSMKDVFNRPHPYADPSTYRLRQDESPDESLHHSLPVFNIPHWIHLSFPYHKNTLRQSYRELMNAGIQVTPIGPLVQGEQFEPVPFNRMFDLTDPDRGSFPVCLINHLKGFPSGKFYHAPSRRTMRPFQGYSNLIKLSNSSGSLMTTEGTQKSSVEISLDYSSPSLGAIRSSAALSSGNRSIPGLNLLDSAHLHKSTSPSPSSHGADGTSAAEWGGRMQERLAYMSNYDSEIFLCANPRESLDQGSILRSASAVGLSKEPTHRNTDSNERIVIGKRRSSSMASESSRAKEILDLSTSPPQLEAVLSSSVGANPQIALQGDTPPAAGNERKTVTWNEPKVGSPDFMRRNETSPNLIRKRSQSRTLLGRQTSLTSTASSRSSGMTSNLLPSNPTKINPFDWSVFTSILYKERLTHNRRRWSHLFPSGRFNDDGYGIRVEHYKKREEEEEISEDEEKILNEDIEDNEGTGDNDDDEVTPLTIESFRLNWKSLQSPGILPLTTDYIPDRKERQFYSQNFYSMVLPESPGDFGYEDYEDLIVELVCQRLSQDFQLYIGEAPGTRRTESGLLQYTLTMGHQFHEILYAPETRQVTIQRYVHKNYMSNQSQPWAYEYMLYDGAEQSTQPVKIMFSEMVPFYNWNILDNLVCGYDEDLASVVRYRRIMMMILPQNDQTQREEVPAPPSSGSIGENVTAKLDESGPTIAIDGSGRHLRGGSEDIGSIEEQLLQKEGPISSKLRRHGTTAPTPGQKEHRELLEAAASSFKRRSFGSWAIPRISSEEEDALVAGFCKFRDWLQGKAPDRDLGIEIRRRYHPAPDGDGFIMPTDDSVLEAKPCKMKALKIGIQARKSGRYEWLVLQYDTIYSPYQSFHLEVQWMVAAGASIQAFFTAMIRKARLAGLTLQQIPEYCRSTATGYSVSRRVPHPFVLPKCIRFDSLRFDKEPVFLKLVLDALQVRLQYVVDSVFEHYGFLRPTLVHRQGLAFLHFSTDGIEFLQNRLLATSTNRTADYEASHRLFHDTKDLCESLQTSFLIANQVVDDIIESF